MPIARLIYVTVAPERMADAERVWKHECAPLMIQQPGCLSEELLKCLDAPGEYISYAEWEDQAAIDRYLASPAHDEIRRPAPSLQREGRPVVKRYEVAGPERSSAADRGPRQPARDARDVLAVVGAEDRLQPLLVDPHPTGEAAVLPERAGERDGRARRADEPGEEDEVTQVHRVARAGVGAVGDEPLSAARRSRTSRRRGRRDARRRGGRGRSPPPPPAASACRSGAARARGPPRA